MEPRRTKRGITLVEASIGVVITTLLLGFAWNFYFSGRETMRHTVSQSQVQTDTRIFLDQLEAEMASCYSFFEVNSEQHKFGFYSFTYSRMSLDDILYDTAGNPLRPEDGGHRIRVVKYEYSWSEEDETVTKKRTPGWLYFLREPMHFEEGDPAHFIANFAPMERQILRDLSSFEISGYLQKFEPGPPPRVNVEPIDPSKPEEAVFIVLRLHTHKDQGTNRRDEELDIVTRFYSQARLAEAANPGWFSTTDRDGRF